ncbi:MAG: hypothetical protein JSV36_11290 [Anaerolineae bacterium]|nr:MAG: hypothetical protein JSV36_11290 [Anaerolineae bacterium]
MKRSGALTKASVAKLYGIKPERISHFVEFDVINAISSPSIDHRQPVALENQTS